MQKDREGNVGVDFDGATEDIRDKVSRREPGENSG